MPPAAFAGSIYHNEGLVLPPSVFLVRAKTRSMQHFGIEFNDVLVVDRAHPPEHGSLVVIYSNQQFLVRQYRISPEPAFVDQQGIVTPFTDAQVWGRVDKRVRGSAGQLESLIAIALQIEKFPIKKISV